MAQKESKKGGKRSKKHDQEEKKGMKGKEKSWGPTAGQVVDGWRLEANGKWVDDSQKKVSFTLHHTQLNANYLSISGHSPKEDQSAPG